MIEADMERFVNFDKGDFVGRLETLKVKQTGVQTCCVYFECEKGSSDVRGGEAVLDGERYIGVTTSGGYGHYTGKSLGFAYVPPSHASAGTSFEVMLLGERRQASVIAEPVWDPANERLRA